MPARDANANEATPIPSPPPEITQSQDAGQPDVGLASPDAAVRPAAMNSWEKILQEMERRVNPHSFSTWFRPTKQEGAENGKLIVRVPNRAFRRRLTKTYGELLHTVLTDISEPNTQLEFICDEPVTPKGAAALAPAAAEKAASGAIAESRGQKCPIIPEAAWYGLSREYREIVGPRTEASPNYHLAGFLSAVGACLARCVYIEKPGLHYANLFVVLVGKSGGARKGTGLNFGIDLARTLDPKIGIADSLDSREGFLEHLVELGKQQEHRAGVAAILHLGELRSLIEKTRMEGLGNIVPMLCDAYDCPPVLAVHTRKNPVSVPYPTVSLAAATTPRWIEGLQEKDLEGGLGNRIMWVPGEPGKAIPNPPTLDRRRWGALGRELRKRIAHWPQKHSTRFSFSPAAEKRWETIYAEVYTYNDDDPLIASLCQRLQNHCLKVALIWAALDGQPVIELCHLEAAYAFAQFLYDALWYLFRGFGAPPMAQLDEKIIKMVREAGQGGIRAREVKKRLARWGYELLNRRILHLTVADGPLVSVPDGQRVMLFPADS